MKTDAICPFDPRRLTPSERRHGDLYLFNSPKLNRRVELVSCLTTALALKFEFDPHVPIYVERPRTLTVRGGSVELAFWTVESRGRERFWLLVPSSETIDPQSPRRQCRASQALFEAAVAAHISLEFVFEDQLRRDAGALGACYRMLPYVQSAMVLPNRVALTEQVRAVFEDVPRATLKQIEDTLSGFHPADVRAITFALIHQGELALADPHRFGRFSIIQRRPDHGRLAA
ncbi:MAG: hypothetical protein BGP25_13315 [Lysobacterales bacterium 63-13]|mgnify:FL=1|nr:MAG: hypothetical protein BGP25_13315 [Xanthomonadales bacterium 63-13]